MRELKEMVCHVDQTTVTLERSYWYLENVKSVKIMSQS